MTTAFAPTVTDDFLVTEESGFDCESRQVAATEGGIARVAAMSTDRVMEMTRGEMIEVIGSVRGGHLLPGVRERLPRMDGEMLRRLVFLTRRYCRDQQQLAEGVAVRTGAGAAYCG